MPDYGESELFDELDKLVLAYADGLTTTPARVDDALYADLAKKLGNEQMVELTSAIAWKNYLARFNCGFAVEAEGMSEAGFCLLPDQAN
ncbi:MAG: carboxymuconolactone decarboxylase family protein [Vulcanimicrobiota bacterium]